MASEGQGCLRDGSWYQVREGLRPQFGFGGQYQLEVWREIESYGTYDRLDEDLVSNPEKYTGFRDTSDFLEFGPTRLMGDWPESQFTPAQD